LANSELSLNDQIAAAFREINTDWRVFDHVSSENTDAILKKKSLRPDIMILEPGVPPICLETEFAPANSVEADAAARLGEVSAKTGDKIQVVLAVKIPARFKDIPATKLLASIRSASDFEYCVLTGQSPSNYDRWPGRGFIRGTLRSLFTTIQGAATPPSLIQEGAEALERGAAEIAATIGSIAETHEGVVAKISDALKQEVNQQTFRMAATILINAFVFQENLAGRTGGLETVQSLDEMEASSGMKKRAVLAEWSKILKINYWPIFGISRNLLLAIPANVASKVLTKMHVSASALLTLNLGKSSDLAGVIFQRLISDRRFLATFYTTPASAALLNGLVFRDEVAPNGLPWTAEYATKLRIVDFACGTGSLLTSAYGEVRRHLELNGVSARALHPSFIENSIIGCDVMPSATHITASMLSSAFPEKRYNHTKILTLPFGRQADGSVNLGAIEFLSTQGALSIIDTGAKGVGASGDTEISLWEVGGSGVQDESFDLVVMNPPFTRLTGGGGKSSEVPLPMFAAFGTVAEEQQLMSDRTKQLTEGTVAHGNAGEASIFLQIANNKAKAGGYIALVLPITFLTGAAWQDCRNLICKNYSEVTVVTIASSESGSFAFSADTATGECLLVAKKGNGPAKRVNSVSLTTKPAAPFEGTEIARIIRGAIAAGNVAKLEEGPAGGTPIKLGDTRIGEMLSGPIRPDRQWRLLRIADHSVAQAAHQLVEDGKLWLPGMSKSEARAFEFCELEALGEVGPYHLDISSSSMSGVAPRGPFEVQSLQAGHTATFPILNSHIADLERSLQIACDSEGIARIGGSDAEKSALEDRRERIWATRSRLHLNTDFRFNSQSLAFALTEQESIGGRAWPSFKMQQPVHDFVAVLWFNSTLGLLSYWWAANKSQDGRGSITTTQMPKLVMIDPRKLTDIQITDARQFFEDHKQRKFLPAHQIKMDVFRADLDDFVLKSLLRVPDQNSAYKQIAVLRGKLSEEPSFNGGKL
jgi:hypothetical protein